MSPKYCPIILIISFSDEVNIRLACSPLPFKGDVAAFDVTSPLVAIPFVGILYEEE